MTYNTYVEQKCDSDDVGIVLPFPDAGTQGTYQGFSVSPGSSGAAVIGQYRDVATNTAIVEQELEEDMPDLFRRILFQADPFASECVYLTDPEIRECLYWDELDIPEDRKDHLFSLCKKSKDIFASTGNMGRLKTVQHSIDTGIAAPTKSRPYRLSPEKCEIVRDAVAKMLEKAY